MAKNIRKFGEYTPAMRAAVNKEAEKVSRGGLVLTPGSKNIVRFAPIPDSPMPFVTTFIHWIELPSGKKRWFPCPTRLAGKPCPECEYEKEAVGKAKTKIDRDTIFKRSANLVHYSNVLIGGAEADPQIVKPFNYRDDFRQKLDEIQDNQDGISPWNLKEGYDVQIRVPAGKGKNARDATIIVMHKGAATPLDEDGPWVSQLDTFADRVRVMKPSEISAIMNDDDEEAATKPSRKTAGLLPSGKRNVSDDVDDEDEVDAEEDDDDEDEDEDDE